MSFLCIIFGIVLLVVEASGSRYYYGVGFVGYGIWIGVFVSICNSVRSGTNAVTPAGDQVGYPIQTCPDWN